MIGRDRPELSLVLPVYNEADNIGPVLAGIQSHVLTPHEIVVVYDFDEDTSLPVIRSMMAGQPTIRLHRNDRGSGVLNAMRAGMDAAAAPHILITMADGSDDPADIDKMAELARAGADLVAASRYMPGGRQVGGPRLKRWMSRLAGLSLHWIGRVPVHDPTSNFKLYSRSLLDSVQIESRGGFELAIELTVKATLAGRTLAEVPTTWRDRTAGQSRFRLRAWLPLYLRWYAYLFRGRAAQLMRRST